MRLNIHDFSGHPFQVELSRVLAGRGHEVVHTYSAQYVTGHGRLAVAPDDPSTLRIHGLWCQQPLVKYQPLGRTRFELSYARAWSEQLRREQFDVVVACNVPLFALAQVQYQLARTRQPWVLWHQDLYSLGVSGEARRRLSEPLAETAGRLAERLERAQVCGADGVVAITEAMLDQYRLWGVTREDVRVIPNWAPLDEIRPGPRDNDWTRRQRLRADPLRLVYAGTLGRKHNPLLLLDLLNRVQARGIDAELIVASEGIGASDLAAAADNRPDVHIVGFQPAEDLPLLLAAADVTVALLEPDAARFSVPSKVLSYLAAGRPVVALIPDSNPAAKDVEAAGGFVGAPGGTGAAEAAAWIARAAHQPGELARLSAQARNHAQSRFDIGGVADAFESLFETIDAQARRRGRGRR